MSEQPTVADLERDLPAYARSLGITVDSMEAGSPVLAIPFGENAASRHSRCQATSRCSS